MNDLKERFGLPAPQAKQVEKIRKKQVVTLLGGFDSNAYKELSGRVFAQTGGDFKEYFDLPRYDALPTKRFDEAVDYLTHWQLPTNLGIEICDLNAPNEFRGVKEKAVHNGTTETLINEICSKSRRTRNRTSFLRKV